MPKNNFDKISEQKEYNLCFLQKKTPKIKRLMEFLGKYDCPQSFYYLFNHLFCLQLCISKQNQVEDWQSLWLFLKKHILFPQHLITKIKNHSSPSWRGGDDFHLFWTAKSMSPLALVTTHRPCLEGTAFRICF